MSRSSQRFRILGLPVDEPVSAGRLLTFTTQNRGSSTDLVVDYLAVIPDTIELISKGGKVWERSKGFLHPRRLRFQGVKELELIGLYKNLVTLSNDHPARIIGDLYNWRKVGEKMEAHFLWGYSKEDAELSFLSRRTINDPIEGQPIPFSWERDWSPPPPMKAGLVPRPGSIHAHFGGDPVAIRLMDRIYHHRLFVGGLEIQPQERPHVNAVLNLAERPSRWLSGSKIPVSDLWSPQGEGSQGMDVEQITRLANWVVEILIKGDRVLVHCEAGMNRSATICCAALILLEGLNAEQAIDRLRQHHPWSRPDGHHWLALKWLANSIMDR